MRIRDHRFTAFIVIFSVTLLTATSDSLVQSQVNARRKFNTSEQAELRKASDLQKQLVVLLGQGKDHDATLVAKQLLTISERVLGPEHSDTAFSVNALGVCYAKLRKFESAEPLFKRALRIKEKVFGTDHPETALTLYFLAEVYREKRNYAAADSFYRRSLTIRVKKLGPEHPDTAASLFGLASVFMLERNYVAAEPLLQRTLSISEKVLGPEHPGTATGQSHEV